MVVPGLVTTKRGDLESKDGLKRRIEVAGRHILVEQLRLSPVRPLLHSRGQHPRPRAERAAELRPIFETAEEVWG